MGNALHEERSEHINDLGCLQLASHTVARLFRITLSRLQSACRLYDQTLASRAELVPRGRAPKSACT